MTKTKKPYLLAALTLIFNFLMFRLQESYPLLLFDFYAYGNIPVTAINLLSALAYCGFMAICLGNRHNAVKTTFLLFATVLATDILTLYFSVNRFVLVNIKTILVFAILCYVKRPQFRRKPLVVSAVVYVVIAVLATVIYSYLSSAIMPEGYGFAEGLPNINDFMAMFYLSDIVGYISDVCIFAINASADIITVFLFLRADEANTESIVQMKPNFKELVHCRCPECKEKTLPFQHKLIYRADTVIECPACGCKCSANTLFSMISVILCLILWGVVTNVFGVSLIISLMISAVTYAIVVCGLPYRKCTDKNNAEDTTEQNP